MDNNKLTTQLYVGTALSDITPSAGEQLGGYIGVLRPAKTVLDRLYTKVLTLEFNNRKLCIISLDLVVVTKKYCDMIREAASKFGFDLDAVMITATQTHSAPGLGYFMLDDDFTNVSNEYDWIRGNGSGYCMSVVEKTIEAIKSASENMQAIQMGVGSGIEGRMAFNRRAINRDGFISMPHPSKWKENPLGPIEICYIEGPMDPELGTICFKTESNQMIAMLMNYTCHPVHVFSKPELISADWPGALAHKMQKKYGENLLPIVLNGACGNINPWPPFDPDYIEDHNNMGNVLASMADKIIKQMSFSSEVSLDWKTKKLSIPFRKINNFELESAINILDKHPDPIFTNDERTQVTPEWMQAANIYSVHLQQQREKEFQYEIQIFRIGNTVIVGLPGEPFVEGQLQIKINSPANHTYISHMINQYVGYIPTKEAVISGGHEGATRYWTKLAPEALDMITNAATELINEMFQGENQNR